MTYKGRIERLGNNVKEEQEALETDGISQRRWRSGRLPCR